VVELGARIHELGIELERVELHVEHERRLESEHSIATVEALAKLWIEALVARALAAAEVEARPARAGWRLVGARRAMRREQRGRDERSGAQTGRGIGERSSTQNGAVGLSGHAI